jgi:hypothetical protein
MIVTLYIFVVNFFRYKMPYSENDIVCYLKKENSLDVGQLESGRNPQQIDIEEDHLVLYALEGVAKTNVLVDTIIIGNILPYQLPATNTTESYNSEISKW